MITSAVGLFLAIAAAGAIAVASALRRARRAAPAVDEFLEGLLPGEEDVLATPFVTRLTRSGVTRLGRRLERMLPSRYLGKLDRDVARAGLAGKRRAAEQLAMQLGLAALGMVITFLLLATRPPTALAVSLLVLPGVGFAVPNARLKRTIRARDDKIFRDLPDVVDMLAIAVEAGSGFESALALVCSHFDSPLTDELAIALHEMELGMSRRAALQQLRERSDLDAVRNLVLALLQADALGIPIGRVLKGQASEVRSRRRAWAREKAAKLPVKILFPLVLFIFPPILGLVLGPAAMSFMKMGGG